MNFDFSKVENYLGSSYYIQERLFLNIVQTPWFINEFERLFLENSKWSKRSAYEPVFFFLEDLRLRNLHEQRYTNRTGNTILLKFIGLDETLVISIYLYS